MHVIVADKTGTGDWVHLEFANNSIHASKLVKEAIVTGKYREVIAIPNNGGTPIRKRRSFSHLSNGARPSLAPAAPVEESAPEPAPEEVPAKKAAKKAAKKKASGLV